MLLKGFRASNSTRLTALSLSHVAQSLAATHYSGEYKVQNVATGEYLHFSR